MRVLPARLFVQLFVKMHNCIVPKLLKCSVYLLDYTKKIFFQKIASFLLFSLPTE